MIFPKKLKASDLKHPADKRSAWNGDKIRPASEQGAFASREAQGLKTVAGTRPPSNVKHRSVPVTRQLQPPPDQRYSPALRKNIPDPPPLTDRQQRMLKKKK